MKHQENILAVPTTALIDVDLPIGFTTHPTDIRNVLAVVEADGIFRERHLLEQDPIFRQIISYTILVRDGKVLEYQRAKSGGENRLHDLYSIGVGGHAEKDKGGKDLDELVSRELEEEIEYIVDSDRRPMLRGIINSNDSDVDKVHLGLVYVLELPPSFQCGSGDLQQKNPTFRWHHELIRGKDQLESWSKVLIPSLKQLVRPIWLHDCEQEHASGCKTCHRVSQGV